MLDTNGFVSEIKKRSLSGVIISGTRKRRIHSHFHLSPCQQFLPTTFRFDDIVIKFFYIVKVLIIPSPKNFTQIYIEIPLLPPNIFLNTFLAHTSSSSSSFVLLSVQVSLAYVSIGHITVL